MRIGHGKTFDMAFVKIGSAADLPPDSVMEAEVNGAVYAVCNVAGELHALDGVCPHAGGPLGEGMLQDGRLICPWHAWEYDCRTGANDYDDSIKLAKFAVKTENGEIFLDVPEASAGTA